MKVITKAISSNASFSPCERYRYALCRSYWSARGRTINFIMLNPSTADEDYNDPTVARCERIALANGFTNLIITNLFAYRATDPLAMKAAASQGIDVAGGDTNDTAILQAAAEADMVVCAWGNHGAFMQRSRSVRAILAHHRAKLHYLQMNSTGEPKHPLYVAARHLPTPWAGAPIANQHQHGQGGHQCDH